MTIRYVLAEKFSAYPGGRHRTDGHHSGEEFRDDFLRPALEEAIAQNEVLCVVLDGARGYGSSFLEESFGGLVRVGDFTRDGLERHLTIIAEEPRYETYADEAKQYLLNAFRARRAVVQSADDRLAYA